MELIVILVVLAGLGAGIGALARLILPGPDPMPIWVMVGIGVVAAVVGGLVGYAILELVGAILFAVGGAVGLVFWYRRWKGRKAQSAPAGPPPVSTPTPEPSIEAPALDDRYCSSCGTEFKGDERFCTSCGHPRD